MSLNNDDLKAIKHAIQTTVQPIFDELATDVAAGFAEVHEKFAEVHKKIDLVKSRLDKKIDELGDKLDVRESKFNNTVERVDQLETTTRRLKQKIA